MTAVSLPILVPLATGVLLLFCLWWPGVQRVVSLAGTAGLLAAAIFLFVRVRQEGILVEELGNWPAPYSIVLVADLLSASLVLLTGWIGLTVALYTLGSIERRRFSFGYAILMMLVLASICAIFLTGDLFNLYVWFEVVLIASFGLLLLGNSRDQLEGGVTYVVINLVASAFFLVGVGIIYGEAGTLNLADLAGRLGSHPSPRLLNGGGLLLLIAFGVKAALFPLYFWLPDSYHTPPPAVSALFAGLLTKVGAYAMLRVFTLIFVHQTGFTHSLILAAALLTMVSGALGAAAQTRMGRLLSFSVVSQMGYILLGLGLYSRLGLTGALFFLVHESIVKTGLFMAGGVVLRSRRTDRFEELGGFAVSHPGLSVCFLVCGLSLAGIPPFSGYFAKLVLLQASLQAGQVAAAVLVLLVSVTTLLYTIRLWLEVFWKPAPRLPGEELGAPVFRRSQYGLLLAPVLMLSGATVLLGLWGEPFWGVARQAAADLYEPAGYIAAVLGG